MKLYETLYIFLRYKQDINFLFELIIDFNYHRRKQHEWNSKEYTHYVTLYNAILMHTCSYLEEYNNQFTSKTELEFKDRIRMVKKIAKPAYKKIMNWSDLRQYRNQIIAHNLRINNDIFSFNKLGQYNAPRTYVDLVVLRKHLMMIQGIIDAEFSIEIPKVNDFIESFPIKKQQINYDNIEADIKSVVDEINLNCNNSRKNYNLDLAIFHNL